MSFSTHRLLRYYIQNRTEQILTEYNEIPSFYMDIIFQSSSRSIEPHWPFFQPFRRAKYNINVMHVPISIWIRVKMSTCQGLSEYNQAQCAIRSLSVSHGKLRLSSQRKIPCSVSFLKKIHANHFSWLPHGLHAADHKLNQNFSASFSKVWEYQNLSMISDDVAELLYLME